MKLHVTVKGIYWFCAASALASKDRMEETVKVFNIKVEYHKGI